MSGPGRDEARPLRPTAAELQDVLPRSGGFARGMVALSFRMRQRPVAALAVGIGCFLVALAARFGLDLFLPPGFPFLTFFPAVILAAFFGGARAGAVCGLLGGLAAWFWFIPPRGSFALEAGGAAALTLFGLIVTVHIGLLHLLGAAIDRLLRQRREMAGLLETQRTLFSELQHRVANNLAIVSALFGLQTRRLADNPEAAAAFQDARLRLDTMSRVHRRLYDPANVGQPLAGFLEELLRDMLDGAGRPDIAVSIDAPECGLATNARMPLMLIVAEIATNALKHAFEGRGGRIAVRLERLDAERCRLTMRDDGPGFPPGRSPGAGGGQSLGLRILESFAASLKGSLAFANDGGAVVTLDFPAPDRRRTAGS